MKTKTWMMLCAVILAGATAAAATPEGHYGGTVTAQGIDGGRITFMVDKASVVGVFACKLGKTELSVPLQGVLDGGKLALTAPAKTPGVTALRFAGEAKDGVYRGTFEGVLRGKKIKGEFTAGLSSN